MTTLADIVNNALSQSEESLKLASARDAAAPAVGGGDLDFLDSELLAPSKLASDHEFRGDGDDDEDDKKAKKAKKDEKEPEKKASRNEVLADADYAMKLAEALNLGSNIVSAKLATDGARSAIDAPGPEVHEGGFHTTPTVTPKAHSTVTPAITGAPTNAGPNGLPTNKPDFTSTGDQSGRAKNHPGKTASDWTKSKEASMRILRAKVAQAEVFMNLGNIGAAEQILNEVKATQEKIAQDPSSPPPVMPAHNESFKLDTEPGPSTVIPDNAGLISMDKATAKDRTTREATQFISEQPKRDNAVPAHTLRTDGQKLSHLVLPRKTAAAAEPTKVSSAPAPAKAPESTKKASLDPEMGRAYLSKLVKTASDPEASQADRTKAASALTKIKAQLGFDPEQLLS